MNTRQGDAQLTAHDPRHTFMSDIQKRIVASFADQGLMAAIGARLVLVSDGEVHIELPFSERLSQ
jgi:acyl-coenzyme A thioesterase PaaI-like protein